VSTRIDRPAATLPVTRLSAGTRENSSQSGIPYKDGAIETTEGPGTGRERVQCRAMAWDDRLKDFRERLASVPRTHRHLPDDH
jgi:hypothetical protein